MADARKQRAAAVAISSGAVLLAGCQFGGLNSLDMPGTAGHGSGSYTDHRRTARCGDAAAELAGDGRRRHRRQRVRHRRGAASRRHVLRRGAAVAGRATSTCRPTPPPRWRRPRCWAPSTSSWPRPSTGSGRRQARRGLQYPAGPHRPLPDHRRSAVVARRRGEQGQSRCAAGHHRRDLQRGRRPRGQLRRPDPAARRADQLAGSADRRHHRRGRRAEPVRGHPGPQQGQSGPHPGHAARRAGGAEQQPQPTSSTRSARCSSFADDRLARSCSRPRTTSPPTSRTCTR